MKTKIDLSPPWKSWLFVWCLVIGLYSLHVVSFYYSLTLTPVLFIGVSTLVFYVINLILRWIYNVKHYKTITIDNNELLYLKKKANKYLKIWLFGNLFTVIIEKGFPLFWLLSGSSKSYMDFGIPTIQGFLNAIYSISVIIYVLNYIDLKKKKDLFIILLLLIYPITILSRGLVTLILLEILGVFVLFNKINLLTILKGSILLFLFILLFGIVGDFRIDSQQDIISDLINPNYQNFFSKIPSGFYWVYLYTTLSFNNIVGNLLTVVPLYYPYYTISPLLPTFLRDLFYDTNYSTKYALEMANNSFNTFTVFSNFLKDFGIAGALIVFSLIQYISSVIHLKARKNVIWAILSFPVIYAAVLLSVFDNFFTMWYTIFQILLAIHLNNNIKKQLNLKDQS